MSTPSTAELDAIALRPRGGSRTPRLPPTYARDLTDADAEAIAAAGGKPRVAEPALVMSEIRAKHHTIAQMLAAGAPLARVSFVTGISANAIGNIRKSPLFQELLNYYAEQKQEEFADFYRKAAQVGMDAVELIHDRILNSPDDVKLKEALAIAEALLDRTILPSKAAGGPNGGGGAPAQAAPMVIQFIDSPHAGEPLALPQAARPETIDITPREVSR